MFGVNFRTTKPDLIRLDGDSTQETSLGHENLRLTRYLLEVSVDLLL